jgi:hypothetical protein
MVSFFEQSGRFVRCETRAHADGTYELLVIDEDGHEEVEQFTAAESLDKRLAELESHYRASGWFGPYGRRS